MSVCSQVVVIRFQNGGGLIHMVNFVLGFADDEGRSFLWYEPSRELTHPPELHGEGFRYGGEGGGGKM